MNKWIYNLIVIGILLIVVFLTGCSASKEEVFKIGFIPSEQANELMPKAELLGDFLEKEMGMKVEVVVPTSYEPLMESLRFNHIDAAYMDSGPAWLAYKSSGAEVVMAELKDGLPFYYAEMFTQADSDLMSLDDAIGKKIAFTSWTGSSGFVMPVGTLVQRGLITVDGDDFPALQKALDESFETNIISGGYTQSLQLLLAGAVDIVGGSHDALEKYLEEEDRIKLKSIERLGKVPSHPIVVRNELSPEIRKKFVTAMLKLNEKENVHILQNLYNVEGLVQTTTEEHLADFGPRLDALVGLHDKVLK